MAKKPKKKELSLLQGDIFKPISTIDILGTNNDPCFGLSYDLTTSECKQCGDSELCAIVFAQNMNKTRSEIEKETHFKDMDVLIDTKGVQKFMRGLKRRGIPKKNILSKSMDKFSITKQEARELYRGIK